MVCQDSECHLLQVTSGTERNGTDRAGSDHSLAVPQPYVCTADLSGEICVLKDLLESHRLIEQG